MFYPTKNWKDSDYLKHGYIKITPTNVSHFEEQEVYVVYKDLVGLKSFTKKDLKYINFLVPGNKGKVIFNKHLELYNFIDKDNNMLSFPHEDFIFYAHMGIKNSLYFYQNVFYNPKK